MSVYSPCACDMGYIVGTCGFQGQCKLCKTVLTNCAEGFAPLVLFCTLDGSGARLDRNQRKMDTTRVTLNSCTRTHSHNVI